MELLPYINPLISVTSLIIALYAFRRTYRLNQEVKFLNSRKIWSDQFKTYADLLHQKYDALEEPLSNLFTFLEETNNQIGNLLDKYDNRDSQKHVGYMRDLGHLYVDLHEGILNKYKHELSWQTTENIYWRMANLRRIIPGKDFILPQKGIRQAIRNFISKPPYYPLDSLSTGSFAEAFIELSNAISHDKYLALYHEFVTVCTPFIDYLNSVEDDFRKALKELESGLYKSTLEEFEFREYGHLYGRYIEFMRSLQFVVHSRIPRLKDPGELPDEVIRRTPYFVINYIVYVGGNIRLMNELCGRSWLRFKEY